MENEGLAKAEAYDITRREFYELRRQEQIERRVAQEEARMVGSYFGQTFLQVGMAMEDQQYEMWKKWATKEIDIIRGEQSEAYSSFGETSSEMDELSEELDEMMEPASV